MTWSQILLAGAAAISLVVLIMLTVVNVVGVESSDDEVPQHWPFGP